MSPDDWQRLGSMLTILTAIGWGALQARNGRKEAGKAVGHAEKAVFAAEKAVENTAPISNGFAKRMDTKLDALLAEISDVRGDVRELRGEMSSYRTEHDKRHDRDSRG